MKTKTKQKLFTTALVATSLISVSSLSVYASKAWQGHENMVAVQQDIQILKQRVLDKNTALQQANSKVTDLTNQINNTNTSYRDWETDRKSTRLNSSHSAKSRMPSSA